MPIWIRCSTAEKLEFIMVSSNNCGSGKYLSYNTYVFVPCNVSTINNRTSSLELRLAPNSKCSIAAAVVPVFYKIEKWCNIE